jgi:hypothetical protein
MAHQEDNHGHDHGHDNTEGNRQYYPKGWWIPLVGLAIIALGFGLAGGMIMDHVGTDKWGKSEHVCTDHCGDDCEEACEDEHGGAKEKDDCCKGEGENKSCDKDAKEDHAAGETKNDSVKPATQKDEHGH